MTKLNPLEEVLFRTWARANGIDNHDDPSNYFDHRGLYKQSNGMMQPIGVVKSLTDTHNAGVEASQTEGGDTINPDPYMAQAEMHGNMLKAQGDQRRDQMKAQMEDKKMQHTSSEKEKDRQHKLQLEQMKMQQKAQADEANRQARAQEAEQGRQAHAAEAAQNRQASAVESQKNREAGVQDSMMQEHFTRTRPQDTSGTPSSPQSEPAPPATSGAPQDGGLQHQLMQRQLG